jgi:HD-GYP domain-containing protein (c-di-GMP phosphodiesterase class II)
MRDDSAPQAGTLVRRDQESPIPSSGGNLIERFVSLSGTLTRSTSAADAAEAIGVAALALTGGQRGAVYLHAPDGEATRLWASRGGIPEHRSTSGPVIVSDVRDLPQDDALRQTAEREGYRAVASWPLTRGGKELGSIVCCFDAPRSWSAAELDVMLALAMQGATALECALLAERTGRPQPDAGADDVRIAEALRILQTEGTSLSDAHRELEAQRARLDQARQQLGALNLWLLAVQNELQTERARLASEHVRLTKARDDLASEDARVAAARESLDAQIAAARHELESESARLATAAREALDAQITAARHELESESARLMAMRRELFETPVRQPDPGPEPPAERTPVSDAKRILEAESARLRETLSADSTPPADPVPTPPADPVPTPPADPVPAPQPATASVEPPAAPAPPPQPSNGTGAPVPSGTAYELGGPLPTPRAFEELYPLLVERAAKLLNAERSALQAEEQVKILGRALDDRDGHRAGYSERLEAWVEATAGMLACSREEIVDLRRAALLHDLGKIGVPEAILRGHTRLTEQQRGIVRAVPALAEQVLRPVKGMQGVAAILRHRYEQWDGKGYPDGLKGDQIPLGARILAVADAYGVMTTVRPYRAMVYSLDAVAELRRCAGAQFDPKVVEAFCDVLKREG